MRDFILNKAADLIGTNDLEKSAHALEFLLIIEPNNHELKFSLAQIYIALKENYYRAKAKVILESLVPKTDGELRKKIIRLLITKVYLTHGPISSAADILKKYDPLFNSTEKELFLGEIEKVDRYTRRNSINSRFSKMPDQIAAFDIIEHSITNLVMREFSRGEKSIQRYNKFFTFGSCFASHVARVMKARDIDVSTFWVGEEVNTSFSNLNLINFILGNDIKNYDYYKTVLGDNNKPSLSESLKNSEAVIFTLGVAPAFFNNQGEYVPHNPSQLKNLLSGSNVRYRMSTVKENVDCLSELKRVLTEATSVNHVFLTVSPVPMAASLLSLSNAVDDSESKSILRTAAGEICRQDPEFFTYFPSFEVFRWLPCFRNEAGFGLDDGSSRHPNSDAVAIVVSEFISKACSTQ